MAKAAAIARKTIWLTKEIVNTIVLVIILLLLAFSGYSMWDSAQVHRAANAVQFERFKPADDGGASFEELREINPEVFAWLTIYGTGIDLPVTQGDNNMKYVNMDAFGKYSLSGAIFIDFRNCPHFTDFNTIFFGHHMERQAMFGEIGDFADKEYFETRRYGKLFFDGKERGLEFFAYLHTDAYNDRVFRPRIADQNQQQTYLDMLLDTAMYVREDVAVTTKDRIVLMTTCSDITTNGRDILVGRISEEVFEDPFYIETIDPPPVPLASIDILTNSFSKLHLAIKILISAIPLFLIIFVIIICRTFRKKSRKRGDAIK